MYRHSNKQGRQKAMETVIFINEDGTIEEIYATGDALEQCQEEE